jgi:Ca2+-binding RTX toxin-like protein
LLEVEGQNVTVKTDAALKVIVDDGTNSGVNTLDVKGGAHNEFLVLGKSDTKVELHDHGNDTVLGGSGNDTIVGNHANDLLIAGAGNTKVVAGSGYDTLVGGAGKDTLVGGSGHDTLVAGSGADTLTGVQGDLFTVHHTMPASGNDVSITVRAIQP